ncbi:MFS transporter [Ignavibacteria bacterium]|jgi:MFS family permease|nr:MFS transporter [Bacteroidota bacterium]MCZ2132975.1 MFS transporter [Bacteroidota bacterium]
MPQTSTSPLSRTVWLLSLVSMLADIASEMLYPILPIYLPSIGFSAAWIGLLEGTAEAVAGLSKGLFGALSDRLGRRLPLVNAGYFLSAIAKPPIGFISFAPAVLLLRALDRLGKGMRSAPRDALLAEESSPETRARVFGFHRGMDTFGAAIGPALALFLLWKFPGDYRAVFLWAIVPGIAAAALTFVIREKRKIPNKTKRLTLRHSLAYWREATPAYRHFTALMFIFALANSSDMFLLIRMKSAGLDDIQVIGAYILFNLVFALLSYPFGALSDKFGKRRILTGGLLIFGMVYCGFGIMNNKAALLALIILYGVYNAATQGVVSAVIANLCPQNERAAGIGSFAGLQSIGSLGAGLIAGAIWTVFGPTAMFIFSGATAFLLAPLVLRVKT